MRQRNRMQRSLLTRTQTAGTLGSIICPKTRPLFLLRLRQYTRHSDRRHGYIDIEYHILVWCKSSWQDWDVQVRLVDNVDGRAVGKLVISYHVVQCESLLRSPSCSVSCPWESF